VSSAGNRRVLVVGDVLLDSDIDGDVDRVCPDAPAPVVEIQRIRERAGGAGLAATLLVRPGVEVMLATGLADDEPAKRLAALLTDRLPTSAVVTTPGTRCKTRVRSAGQSLVRLDTEPPVPAPSELPCDPGLLEELLREADAVVVSDYAGGVVGHPAIRSVLARWGDRVPIVWDPHPRGDVPVAGTTVATPNRAEAVRFHGDAPDALDRVAAGLRERWLCAAVAVTDGMNGVFTAAGNATHFTPAPLQYHGDSCGAGDRFAGTVGVELAGGADPITAVGAAVTDTAAWLFAGGVSAADEPRPVPAELDAGTLVQRTRAAGGTVVATGGCFDVLHAGHVASLEASRGLGDLLVVLVNSDESVRRLKGAGRPVHGIEDRCRVLRSLRSVDAVEVFDGDDPSGPLRRLRPDIWAKGADYAGIPMPEAPLLTGWGGRIVLLPLLAGRSTTRILTRQEGDL
jgi:D-beta-D-heptose 7-phosphate kinase / D-beta-D-heptose 1-phosphate adenosyltransferase